MKLKKVKLDDSELSIVISALNELRNKLIKNKMDVDILNELLMRFINVLEK